MVTPCPYCDAEPRALKNHVRLTDGEGHGPRGEYPPGFESPPDQGDPDTRSVDAGNGMAVQQRETLDERESDSVSDGGGGESGENLVVLPESLLEELESRSDESAEAENDDVDERPGLDPEAAAAKADELDWGAWAGVLLVLVVTALAIGAARARAAAERGRREAAGLGAEFGL